MALNIVEAVQDENADCAFDQPCKFGHRVEGHAVYCHNDAWTNRPRKCRRTWYTGGKTKDEDCPGFQPNEAFAGTLEPASQSGDRCTKCSGTKLIKGDRNTVETCPLCMGDGTQPRAMKLTRFEQDALERAHTIAVRPGERFVVMATTEAERDSVHRLSGWGLVVLRSASYGGDIVAYLLESTEKGFAVMQANWEVAKK